eukprot:TRINITY_DN3199_c0_g1_i11.p2 TRINITY_DN3199_c0_g1~~TRINITY_DN3199_c0_g1_i11.p2  ORF type:complete len:212 (-),score=-2.09 TRINITY_DN3199_c0_g1_i11:424-1059(-)
MISFLNLEFDVLTQVLYILRFVCRVSELKYSGILEYFKLMLLCSDYVQRLCGWCGSRYGKYQLVLWLKLFQLKYSKILAFLYSIMYISKSHPQSICKYLLVVSYRIFCRFMIGYFKYPTMITFYCIHCIQYWILRLSQTYFKLWKKEKKHERKRKKKKKTKKIRQKKEKKNIKIIINIFQAMEERVFVSICCFEVLQCFFFKAWLCYVQIK